MQQHNFNPSIKKTGDGSTSLYSGRFGQHYHNPNGAVAESRHVFFQTPGVPEALHKAGHLSIFETGFGTGLNLLLVHEYLSRTERPPDVTYTSVEAFPVDAATASRFHFGDHTFLNRHREVLIRIFDHSEPGLNRFRVSAQLTLNLFIGFFDDFPVRDTSSGKADFIFHDPFSPDVNPDLWTPDVFSRLGALSRPDALLSTYCAASRARAAMAVAGWAVARAPGALGKREMTLASRNAGKLNGCKRVNEKRLIERFEKGDFA